MGALLGVFQGGVFQQYGLVQEGEIQIGGDLTGRLEFGGGFVQASGFAVDAGSDQGRGGQEAGVGADGAVDLLDPVGRGRGLLRFAQFQVDGREVAQGGGGGHLVVQAAGDGERPGEGGAGLGQAVLFEVDHAEAHG